MWTEQSDALALGRRAPKWVVFLLFGRGFLQFLGGEGQVPRHTLHIVGRHISGRRLYRGMGQMQFPAGIMILNAAIDTPIWLSHFGLGRLSAIGHCWCCGVCGDLRSAGVSAVIYRDCQRPVVHLRRSA